MYHRKTNRKNKIRNTRKKGGKQFKHRRVGLYFTEPTTNKIFQINCEICRNNDYIERPSTLGKSKENQVIVDILVGDTFDDINNISIITYFCRICGMAKIVRNDKNNYIYTKDIK